MTKGISRRDFLVGAGTLATAAAAMGAAGCASESQSLSETGAIIGAPETWDMECDYLVCGYGAAGIGAMKTAYDLGVDMANELLVIEKMPEGDAGADMYCNAGLVSNGGVERWYETSGRRTSREMAQIIDDCRNAQIEWAFDNLDFETSTATSGVTAGVECITGGGGPLWEAYNEFFVDLGTRIEYNTEAKRLIQNGETKEIIGVQALRDGSPINIKARKAVILTTGGYDANRDLISTFVMPDVEAYATCPIDDGAGLLMGMAVGGALDPMSKGFDWCLPHCFAKASEDAGTAIIGSNPLSAKAANRIKVGPSGKRFIDESVTRTHSREQFAMFEVGNVGWTTGDADAVKNAAGRPAYQNLPVFLIGDQQAFDEDDWGNSCVYYSWANVKNIYMWTNEDALEKGYLWKADTLEELADLMVWHDGLGDEVRVNKEGLLAEIERYNNFCAAGQDDDFNRKPETLKPIATPPFYAAAMAPYISYSVSGLKTNDNQGLINWFGEDIPRVYAAGNLSTRTFWYPAGGMFGCMALAQIAMEHAVTLEPWETEPDQA